MSQTQETAKYYFLPVQLTVASRTVGSVLFVRLSMGRHLWGKVGQGAVQVVLHACCSAVSALAQTQHQLLPWDMG